MAVSQPKERNSVKLTKLTETERKYAEENHNLIYSFLHRHGYSIEDYYNIVVFGYLKAVQIYHRKEKVKVNYDFPFIAWQYMRAEISNHVKTENVKKRKTDDTVVSLDAEREKTESKYDFVAGTESVETTVIETEMYQYMLQSLTEKQREIVKAKLSGYSNQEILILLNIPSSSFYKEMQKIKVTIGKIIG